MGVMVRPATRNLLVLLTLPAWFVPCARAQHVEFRLRELTSQASILPPNDQTFDIAVEARVVGADPNVGLASFAMNILVHNDAEPHGTLALLRTSNADGTLYTGSPLASTAGGAFAGLAFAYRSRLDADPAANGIINASLEGWPNDLCMNDISRILADTTGPNLLRYVDANQNSIPDTSSTDALGTPPALGDVALLDPTIAQSWFGANGEWTQVYRFRYTRGRTSVPYLTFRAVLTQTPTVFSQMRFDGTRWAPVSTRALTITTVNLDNAGYPAPICRADFNSDFQTDVSDIFNFLNTWFTGCIGQVGMPCFGTSADFNCNGFLDPGDIFDFLNRWFTGC